MPEGKRVEPETATQHGVLEHREEPKNIEMCICAGAELCGNACEKKKWNDITYQVLALPYGWRTLRHDGRK